MDGINNPEQLSKMEPGIDNLRQWINAIKTNDATSITNILDLLSDIEKSCILNDAVNLINGDKLSLRDIHQKYRILMQATTPMELALAYKARDVIKVFLDNSIDVTYVNADHGTLVHYMIHLCSINHEEEEDIAELYQWFIGLLSDGVKLKLLGAENKQGIKPIELATEYGLFKLFKSIMETKDVYMVEEEAIGVLTYQRFDITEYEGSEGSRSGKSPLAFITYMSENCLSKPGIADLFSWMPLEQWYQMKTAASWPLVCIWLLLRVGTIMSYYALMGSHMERSALKDANISTIRSSLTGLSWCDGDLDLTFSATSKTVLLWYVTIYSACVIILDMCELIYAVVLRRPYAIYQMCIHHHNTVVSIQFHRISQHILSWVFTAGGLPILLDLGPDYEIIAEVTNVGAAIGYFGSILYFLQLVPSIGHNVVTIQRMISDLFHFSILFFLCVSPFARYFVIFFANNSNEGCIDSFGSFTDSMYSSFTIMLNMVNFGEFDVANRNIIRIAHLCFVFIIAILLVNFLIALMSNSASEISQNKLLVQKLERLQVANILEFRLGWALRCYYMWMKNRRGMVVDNRVLLTNIQWTTSMNNKRRHKKRHKTQAHHQPTVVHTVF